MENEEKQSIESYKLASDKLGAINKAQDLIAPDFDPEAYPQVCDKTSKLRAYLDEIEPYAKKLQEAATLREKHYQNYLSPEKEDEGHKFWREAMNSASLDTKEKVNFWHHIWERSFDCDVKYNEMMEKRPKKRIDITVENVDKNKCATATKNFSMSKEESQRRKNALKRAKQKKKAQQKKEEESLIEEFMDHEEYKLYQKSDKKTYRSITDFVELLKNLREIVKSKEPIKKHDFGQIFFQGAFPFPEIIKNYPNLIFKFEKMMLTIANKYRDKFSESNCTNVIYFTFFWYIYTSHASVSHMSYLYEKAKLVEHGVTHDIFHIMLAYAFEHRINLDRLKDGLKKQNKTVDQHIYVIYYNLQWTCQIQLMLTSRIAGHSYTKFIVKNIKEPPKFFKFILNSTKYTIFPCDHCLRQYKRVYEYFSKNP